MKLLYLTSLFFNIQLFSFAQCDSTLWAANGTYELVRVGGSTEFPVQSRRPLTNDELCLIESSRQDYHYAYIQLDAYTRVKIHPKYNSPVTIER